VNLHALIGLAKNEGASDLHLEPGLSAVIRVRGCLRSVGEPCGATELLDCAREMIGPDDWPRFLTQRSFDMSRTIEGLRCRINILQTSRGIGFAVRLLPAFQPTIDTLNLHPDLKQLVNYTTLAALVQTINLSDARHIVTIESPIEFTFRPRKSFIRQREVGRDTPSFEQALLDSLREEPDVLMVGEMREPETMRLTLSAAETGHLVLATVHSSNCAEALQRVVNAFPPEIQSNIAAQLADCLIGVVSQRLLFHPTQNICVPECEVLKSTMPIKNFIRNRDFFKIVNSVETGAEHGMWTFQRYRSWLDKRSGFHLPMRESETDDEETAGPLPAAPRPPVAPPSARPAAASGSRPEHAEAGRIEIEPPEIFEKILKKER
jgi:twitching motility protein PilT